LLLTVSGGVCKKSPAAQFVTNLDGKFHQVSQHVESTVSQKWRSIGLL
jgi:hypothetical protein